MPEIEYSIDDRLQNSTRIQDLARMHGIASDLKKVVKKEPLFALGVSKSMIKEVIHLGDEKLMYTFYKRIAEAYIHADMPEMGLDILMGAPTDDDYEVNLLLGDCHMKLEQYDTAAFFYGEAIEKIAESGLGVLGDNSLAKFAECYLDKATACEEAGRFDEASNCSMTADALLNIMEDYN